MHRFAKLSMLCAAAGVVSACNSEPAVVNTVQPPSAGVRFIHAVPDTGALDARFVDKPENSSHFNIIYRNNVVTSNAVPASTQVQYKLTEAGNRHLKIFLNSTNQAVAQTVLKDTTITFEANKNYTLLLWGYANPTGPNRPAGAPAMQLTVIDESVADPSPNVALRVINTSTQSVDVRHYPNGGTAPATAQWPGVGPQSIASYVNATPGLIRFNVRNAGTATAFITTDALALRGDTALTGPPGPIDAAPGTTVAGSAVTALIFPRSVAGTAAPNVTVPSISFIWDRRPPRPPGL